MKLGKLSHLSHNKLHYNEKVISPWAVGVINGL